MKIDLEKFLAATMLLATATTPACGGGDAKKADTKAESKTAAQPAPAATPPAATPPPAVTPTPPPATTPPATPPADVKAGSGAAKEDPGPPEETLTR